ncbi:hypothetical protein [Streptomyces triticirhizae]|uniref:Restriction endonuclease type IV Mrr domain-containing protein n=1 Tax=Streptomyces triticirhizae TaxID=2483353 RepID=A0A3M2LIZ3_9ACTN|nr:hypothetical protein [Streptomyces triticirhizae]RMI37444.1 hypothetical protein EBN88_19070 [Streptomyces triticirhizae]
MDTSVRAEADLLEQGRSSLARLLGPGWQVSLRHDESDGADRHADALFHVTSPDGSSARLVVDVRRRATPRVAADVLRPMASLVRRVNQLTGLLVISPWISPPTREALRAGGIDYLDLPATSRSA